VLAQLEACRVNGVTAEVVRDPNGQAEVAPLERIADIANRNFAKDEHAIS
jgi:hypothetical protein